MFIGGLNWDTTDGAYITVLFACLFVLLNNVSIGRGSQKVLHTIWQSRSLHNHARCGGSVKMLRFLDF